MPNRTLYFRDEQDDYLIELVERNEQFDNRSQVVQYLINAEMQRDIIEDQQ